MEKKRKFDSFQRGCTGTSFFVGVHHIEALTLARFSGDETFWDFVAILPYFASFNTNLMLIIAFYVAIACFVKSSSRSI